MTTVKIHEIDAEKGEIYFSGFDGFIGTPVLDIIPYIPCLDRVKEFYMPDWVKHCPEWNTPEILSTGIDEENLAQQGDLLKKYKKDREGKVKRNFLCFEENDKIDTDNITVVGARQNNLKNISHKIPKNRLTVITGLSGSGKSSLAFDTIYAEAQRRYTGSLSGPLRLAANEMDKPDVDIIEGLLPAVAIEQNRIIRNSRSTVGTITDIYDYLRMLYSKAGTRYCPSCGKPVKKVKPYELAREIEDFKEGTCFNVYIKDGDSKEKVLFEYTVSQSLKERGLLKCIEDAYKEGKGTVGLDFGDGNRLIFSCRSNCPYCDYIFLDLRPSTFSYNNPEGMCKDCSGLGTVTEIVPELIVKKPELSLLEGASDWGGNLGEYIKKPLGNWMKGETVALAQHMGVDLTLPWNKLPEEFRHYALYGYKERELTYHYESPRGRKGEIKRSVYGAVNHIERLLSQAVDNTRLFLQQFTMEKECPACRGERLGTEGRYVTLLDTRYPEAAKLTVREAYDWMVKLEENLYDREYEISVGDINRIYWK